MSQLHLERFKLNYDVNVYKYPTQCLGLIQIKMSASANQKVNCFHHVIQSHQNSYFPSAIRTWNNLPAVLISVPTLEAFKVELARVNYDVNVYT
jgi:hypothetical protein